MSSWGLPARGTVSLVDGGKPCCSRTRVSRSAVVAMFQKFWSALGLSVALHVAVLGSLPSWTKHRKVATSESAPIDFAPEQLGSSVHESSSSLPVEVEPPSADVPATAPIAEPVRVTPPTHQSPLRRRSRTETQKEPQASLEPAPHPHTIPAVEDPSEVNLSALSDAGTSQAAEPSVDRASLHQAMAAAAIASKHTNTAFTQPVVRVDPTERNLDRAFARAYAWAFALDRSFFSAAPLGLVRFTVELGDDGKITRVAWREPHPPERLKQLVERMAKLLSVNRFTLPAGPSEGPKHRGFGMSVTDKRVAVPPEVTTSEGQVGDIWMLAAGETPTEGHPSYPSVADVTGHRIDCRLEILVPQPQIVK